MSKPNTPINTLLDEYTEECCDFSDVEWVIRSSKHYVDHMPDSQVRCLLHTLINMVEMKDV